jgi:acetyl esterase/lipase
MTSLRRRSLLGLAAMPLVAACSPLAALNATVPADGYRLIADQAYGGHPRQKLDLYVPDGLTGPAPVALFFYGGRWEYGDRADYRFAGQALAAQGFVAAVADYRLYPEVSFPAFVHDGAAAVAWVHAHAAAHGGDPSSLTLLGHSAGAHIAAMLALDGSYLAAAAVPRSAIRAMVGLAGPYDFLPLRDPVLQAIFAPAGDLRLSQPITFASAAAPPLLLLHGSADGTVYPRNSVRLAARITDAGGRARAQLYPELGHIGILLALSPLFRGKAPVLADIAAFIRAEAERSSARA